jgi:hypothetical protein
MVILLVVIGCYFIGAIGGYSINWWLLMVIIFVDISGYSINGYWWIFYWWILVIINDYYINGYWWLIY